jgi:hypothetical protein
MEKDTIIAKLRAALEFSDQGRAWLSQLGDVWFARDGGDVFFSEFRGGFTEAFSRVTQAEISDYFRERGIPPDILPRVQILETYSDGG